MFASRKRRFVGWTVIGVVAPALLLASYVSTWLVINRAQQATGIPINRFSPVFRPIDLYCAADLPGSGELGELYYTVNPRERPFF